MSKALVKVNIPRGAGKTGFVLRGKYRIFDWAGNAIRPEMIFSTVEDAWDYIHGELTDELGLTEEDYGEYEVRALGIRESRFLDVNDPRKGQVSE